MVNKLLSVSSRVARAKIIRKLHNNKKAVHARKAAPNRKAKLAVLKRNKSVRRVNAVSRLVKAKLTLKKHGVKRVVRPVKQVVVSAPSVKPVSSVAKPVHKPSYKPVHRVKVHGKKR